MRNEWMNGEAGAGAGEGVSRRGFLKASTLAGLVLGFTIPDSNKFAAAQNAAKKVYAPNAFLHITPDGLVTVAVNRLEFGQGVHTSLPMLIAEELDADWSKVRAELAPAGDAYKDPGMGMQMTGGSGSVRNSFVQYREIGARARLMLIAAAAQQWKIAPEQCTTANGFVTGPAGQKASYGSLADAAMKMPVPQAVTLKDPKQFKVIGKPTRRIDARAKSTGRQQFGIDLALPGMKVAVVAHPPVFGAKVARFDASKAKAVKGVVAVLQVPVDRGGSGVAVIADGYWPAKVGRDALAVEWDTASVAKTDSAAQMAAFRERSKTPGVVARKADTSALASAPARISAVYEFPYLAHAPMEPLNCVVDLRADSCTVWAGSQFQTVDQGAVAATAGLPADKVTFHTMMAGGGFGRRAVPTSDYIVEAVNIAKAYRAAGHSGPVKLVWSREDDIRGGYYRPSYVHRAELGLDAKGNIVAWEHAIVGQSIMKGRSRSSSSAMAWTAP
jgi:isoquinoline 1-oxidoreductase beta subunit